MVDESSMKRQIVLAAEALFAKHGIEGVSLRQIRMSAGNANNSAVHYHFGSKAQLVQAIFEYRLEGLADRREELVDELGLDSVRAWLECHVRAIMELADQPDSHYMAFLSELTHQRDSIPISKPGLAARVARFHGRLETLLDHIDGRVRAYRMNNVESFMLHVAANRERARDWALPQLDLELAIAELINTALACLEAPSPSKDLGTTQAVVGQGPLFVV